MKIDLKKFRNGVSTVVRKQISFLCCELFPAFLHFSNTASYLTYIQYFISK